MEDKTELKVWKASDHTIPHDAVVRDVSDLAAPGQLQLGLNCRIRKTYTNADGSTHMVSTSGQLVLRDGDVVAVKVSTRFSFRYLGLTSFLKEARADEMSLATLGGGSGSLKCCPCFEWEGTCKRCQGSMVQLGVHHEERKIRVNVIDHVRGIDAWVPLYIYAAHQLMDLNAFCKAAGVVTATPMHVVKIEVGSTDLPDGLSLYIYLSMCVCVCVCVCACVRACMYRYTYVCVCE